MSFLKGKFLRVVAAGGGSVPVDDTDLKSYWKFDELSGDIINVSEAVADLGAAADLQTVGATYDQAGILGKSLLYDGTNDESVAGSSLSQYNFMHNTSMKFTFNLWYKFTTSLDHDDTFFNTTGTGANGNVGISIKHSNASTNNRESIIYIYSASGMGIAYSTDDLFFPDDLDWHMLTITMDYTSKDITWQIDAGTAQTDTITGTHSTADASGAAHVCVWATSAFYRGYIDEFAIWDRILAADEITNLYNGGAGLAIY